MGGPCIHCGCTAPLGDGAHAIASALQGDDLDAAIMLGLLEAQPCPDCSEGCREAITKARDTRRAALAARERYRARATRLQARKAEREAVRRLPAPNAAKAIPALPDAAADALARALAKARERHR